MKTYLALIVSFFIVAIGFGQTYIGNQKHIDKILKNIEDFSKHVVSADYDKIVASYTDDGKIFPNTREIMSGPGQLRSYWILPKGVSTIRHKITPVEIKIIGKEAYDYGYYEGATKRADGSEVSWQGKYVIVWRRVGKDWKIYLDIWNSINE